MYNKIPESAINCGNAINILSHSHIIKYEYINIGLNTNGHHMTAGNRQRARVLQLKGCHRPTIALNQDLLRGKLLQTVALSDGPKSCNSSTLNTTCNYAEHVSLFLTQCEPKIRRCGALDTGFRANRSERWDQTYVQLKAPPYCAAHVWYSRITWWYL